MRIRFIKRRTREGKEGRKKAETGVYAGSWSCVSWSNRASKKFGRKMPRLLCKPVQAQAQASTSTSPHSKLQIPKVQLHEHTSQWVEEERFRESPRFQWLRGQVLIAFSPQVPKARLVAGRWLVLTTRQLESKHSSHGRRAHRHHRRSLESQRQPGIPRQDARASQILPQPKVGFRRHA